jgi:hypothetical protein
MAAAAEEILQGKRASRQLKKCFRAAEEVLQGS